MNDPESSSVSNPKSDSSDSDITAVSTELPSEIKNLDVGSIGPYRLRRKLGEGGMGSIWLAEQTAPVKREVAIKIIRSGHFTDRDFKRFELERQSLAIMNHPAIAKVFDAGATSGGQPYFVMEYVPGLTITKYCNQKHLSPRERIELMIQVCEGVQHAHQKAIIHRDLKPSNILVTEIDGRPVPRIIDFGIAKAWQSVETVPDETINAFTQAGGTVGTPGYMSPEQADPSVLDIDTRTDVYSLGVVLYELLTASLPFDPKQWRTKPLHEVLRQLHEEDPPAPSTRVSTASSAAAQNAGVEPNKLISQLRGDLDWITLKAIDRDRERRYVSPAELAADLTRYLRSQPITARPPSFSYRVQKFVGRNRLAVAFTSALVLMLAAFAISMTLERNRARREAEVSRRVSDFMADIFKISDPNESRGNSVTAREILDKASDQIEKGLGQDPQLQARLMQTMGATYRNLGIYDQAYKLLDHAVAIQTKTLGPENPDTLRSMALLGVDLEALGRFVESEKLLRQALAGQQRVLGREHPETMATVSYLTDSLNREGHYAEAEGLIRRTLANQQRTVGPENPATLRSMRSLTQNLELQRRLADAEKLGRETIALEQHALGADHPATLWSMNQLALALQDEGHYPEAETLFRETLASSTRVLGPDHANTRASSANLGIVLQQQGRFFEAETTQRQELAATLKMDGPENPDTLNSMDNLGITLGKEHKYQESEKLLRTAYETALRNLGPINSTTRESLGNLATTLAYEKRADESISLFEKLLTNSAKAEGGAMVDAHYQYAVALASLGRKEEAFQHLQKAVRLGLANVSSVTTDDDLKTLKDDPRFQPLIEQVKKNEQTAK